MSDKLRKRLSLSETREGIDRARKLLDAETDRDDARAEASSLKSQLATAEAALSECKRERDGWQAASKFSKPEHLRAWMKDVESRLSTAEERARTERAAAAQLRGALDGARRAFEFVHCGIHMHDRKRGHREMCALCVHLVVAEERLRAALSLPAGVGAMEVIRKATTELAELRHALESAPSCNWSIEFERIDSTVAALKECFGL